MTADVHPQFPAVAAETKIWRYLDLAKFLSLLEKAALHFSSLIALSNVDPYEGHYTDIHIRVFNQARRLPLAEQRVIFKIDASISDENLEKILELRGRHIRGEFGRDMVYVNCWHINSGESDAMWRLYTLQGQGIAIQSTCDRLFRCFHMQPKVITISPVKYHDYDQALFPNDNLLRPAFAKRLSFQHEEELRCATFGPNTDSQRGMALSIDLDILVERIVLSPLADRWIYDLVASTLRRYGLHKPLAQSPLYTRQGLSM
jgi:hypothetical protein